MNDRFFRKATRLIGRRREADGEGRERHVGIGFRSVHITHLKIFTNIRRASRGGRERGGGTSEVAASVDTLCSRANICPVSQGSRGRQKDGRDPTEPRKRARDPGPRRDRARNANRMSLPSSARPSLRRRRRRRVVPMLARIKMLQIMGYLSVVPPCSSRCHSDVFQRNARGRARFFVSDMLSA